MCCQRSHFAREKKSKHQRKRGFQNKVCSLVLKAKIINTSFVLYSLLGSGSQEKLGNQARLKRCKVSNTFKTTFFLPLFQFQLFFQSLYLRFPDRTFFSCTDVLHLKRLHNYGPLCKFTRVLRLFFHCIWFLLFHHPTCSG